MVTGSYNTYEGAVTASIGPGVPALYVLSSSFDGWGGGPERFGEVTFKDTFGGPEKVFREALQVQVTGSRLSKTDSTIPNSSRAGDLSLIHI